MIPWIYSIAQWSYADCITNIGGFIYFTKFYELKHYTVSLLNSSKHFYNGYFCAPQTIYINAFDAYLIACFPVKGLR